MSDDVHTVNTEPRPYHHGNLRDALIAEGLRLLEERDAAHVGLREVARRVGVSPTAVYRHFPNKEALLAALAASGFRQLTEWQAEAIGGKVTRTSFNAMGRAYVRFALANPALFRLMYSAASPTHAGAVDPTLRPSTGLRTAVDALLGPEATPAAKRTMALRAWALVHGLSLLLLDGHVKVADKELDAFIDASVEGGALSIGL